MADQANSTADDEGLRPASGPARLAGHTFLFAVGAWLVAAVIFVGVEYYDGVSAICNARYFLGSSSFYLFDRGPLMAWILMPAEALKQWLGLHPLTFLTHHATSALLHFGYVVAVYRGLVGSFGHHWSVLISFATAITSFMFASYAPFLSHDLWPGALFLWMVIWSDRFAQAPRSGLWLWLVVAGTLAALVKQTFGLFWIAILVAHLLPTILGWNVRTSRRALAWLAVGAATSGMLAWTIYGVVLGNWVPEVPLWLRPYRNLQYLATLYDGTDVTFPWWIYLRNLWAYGRLTTLLLIPAVVLSLIGTGLERRVALAWMTGAILIHLMPLREVRYLACLAPLTAFMVVLAVRQLWQLRFGWVPLAALLTLDVAGTFVEASRIREPFFWRHPAKVLLEPLGGNDTRPLRTIFHNVSMLSFVAPVPSPLAADRYHRIFHLGVHQIGILYGYPRDRVRILPPAPGMALIGSATEASVLLFSNGILAHGPSWQPALPIGSERLVQGLALLQTVPLRRTSAGRYQRADGRDVEIAVTPESSQTTYVIGGLGLGESATGYLMATAILGPTEIYPLQPGPNGSLLFKRPTALGPSALPDTVIIRAFVIQRLLAPPVATVVR